MGQNELVGLNRPQPRCLNGDVVARAKNRDRKRPRFLSVVAWHGKVVFGVLASFLNFVTSFVGFSVVVLEFFTDHVSEG